MRAHRAPRPLAARRFARPPSTASRVMRWFGSSQSSRGRDGPSRPHHSEAARGNPPAERGGGGIVARRGLEHDARLIEEEHAAPSHEAQRELPLDAARDGGGLVERRRGEAQRATKHRRRESQKRRHEERAKLVARDHAGRIGEANGAERRGQPGGGVDLRGERVHEVDVGTRIEERHRPLEAPRDGCRIGREHRDEVARGLREQRVDARGDAALRVAADETDARVSERGDVAGPVVAEHDLEVERSGEEATDALAERGAALTGGEYDAEPGH